MQILKIDHLGIAVNSIEDGKNFWSDVLGLAFEGAETVEAQKVTTAFFSGRRKRSRVAGIHQPGWAGGQVHRKTRSRHPARRLPGRQYRRSP